MRRGASDVRYYAPAARLPDPRPASGYPEYPGCSPAQRAEDRAASSVAPTAGPAARANCPEGPALPGRRAVLDDLGFRLRHVAGRRIRLPRRHVVIAVRIGRGRRSDRCHTIPDDGDKRRHPCASLPRRFPFRKSVRTWRWRPTINSATRTQKLSLSTSTSPRAIKRPLT